MLALSIRCRPFCLRHVNKKHTNGFQEQSTQTHGCHSLETHDWKEEEFSVVTFNPSERRELKLFRALAGVLQLRCYFSRKETQERGVSCYEERSVKQNEVANTGIFPDTEKASRWKPMEDMEKKVLAASMDFKERLGAHSSLALAWCRRSLGRNETMI